MANKRMFSKAITERDSFLDMPISAQGLYFHLGMNGDDDGFVDSPRRIIKSCGCKTEDLKILEKNGFIIIFDSGVLVIRDWKLNNTLKNDRYHPTVYNEEFKHLETDSNGRYNKKA